MKQYILWLALLAFLLLTVGCKTNTSSTAETNLNGTLLAGVIVQATVSLTDETGTKITQGISDSKGNFQLSVPTAKLSGLLSFKSTGGSYLDEVTGNRVTLSSTQGLQARLAANQLSDSHTDVALTADSTLISLAAQHWGAYHSGVTTASAALSAAKEAFSSNFGYKLDPTLRTDEATNSLIVNGSVPERKLALRAMAYSQLTSTLGNSSSTQMSLLNAMGADLADGTLDGKAGAIAVTFGSGTLPTDLLSKFEKAYMDAFGSNRNKTGITPTELGPLPFAKVVNTPRYQVTYKPGSQGAIAGKTMFSLLIADLSGNSVSGVVPSLKPMMHMDSASHSTPKSKCTSTGAGLYACTLYYLMPSAMNGVNMGYWSLEVDLGDSGETATFYPTVKPSMKDTAKVELKAQTEQVMALGSGTEARTYYLFKNSLTETKGNHDLSLFVATQESMSSFPPLVSGATYNSGSVYSFTASKIDLEVSTEGSTWVRMTESGSGLWRVSGLSGLTKGQAAKVYVKMNINGEQKTTDSKAATAKNSIATFILTP